MRHGARTFADAQGRAAIEAAEPLLLQRYRFGLRSADYLICMGCGVYVGAVFETQGAQLATINAAGLDLTAFRGHRAAPVDYAEESVEERLRRRRAAWMPAALNVSSRAASAEEQGVP